jgi:hypothetical protein
MVAEPTSAAPMAAATKVSDVIYTYRPPRKFPAPSGSHYTSIDFDDTGEFLLLSRSDDTIQLFNTKAGAHAKESKSQKYGSALAKFTHLSISPPALEAGWPLFVESRAAFYRNGLHPGLAILYACTCNKRRTRVRIAGLQRLRCSLRQHI